MDTATSKASKKSYKTTLPSGVIITKEDKFTSDEQVKRLNRELNIHFRACIGSFNYLLYSRVDLNFAVHKLEKLSTNPGKVHFEGLVHILRYNWYNKTLVLKYYADVNDAPVSYVLRQAGIKTENHLMVFMILVGKIFQKLAEVQERIFYFI